VDYDNNGFLDIFITNGQGNNKGPYVLLKNTMNDNNWIKIILNGDSSNADGIMTKVTVLTDHLTQFREYNGPSHYMSQDKTNLHFGLGRDSQVNKINIIWPSRVSQALENISANQVITILEGEPIASGKPAYKPGVDLGYFIWKNADGSWHIRSSSDGVKRHFDATITTDGFFTDVASIKFGDHDNHSWDSQVIMYHAVTISGQDGLKFKTTGTQVLFDLKLDGVYLPTAVHIGRHSILPASLPLTLK
jgi:hypothetical protein